MLQIYDIMSIVTNKDADAEAIAVRRRHWLSGGMTPLLLLLALAGQAASVPQAAPPPQPGWRPVGSGNGGQGSYDPASVVRAGPVTRVRLRMDYAGGHSLNILELRCATYEGRLVGSVNYDANGRELSRNDMASPFRAITAASGAGSIGEALARELCDPTQMPASPE